MLQQKKCFFQTPLNKYFANTFLETFQNDLNLIDFKKFEVYFLGDFNINLLLNNKFLLKERQLFDVRNSSSPLLSKYKELCQTFSLKELFKNQLE